MSADEGAQIHENMGYILSYFFLDPNNTVIGEHSAHDWPYIYGISAIIIVLIVMFILVRRRVFENETNILLIVGFSVLLAGAVGMEVLSHKTQVGIWLYVEAVVEELMECIGASILVYASLNKLPGISGINPEKANISRFNSRSTILLGLSVLIVILGSWLWMFPIVSSTNKSLSRSWSGCELPLAPGAIILNNCSVVSVNGNNSMLTYGPYIKLDIGIYTLRVRLHADGDPFEIIGSWDIVSDFGKNKFSEGVLYNYGISNSSLIKEFELKNVTENVEFRIYSAYSGAIRLFHISVSKN